MKNNIAFVAMKFTGTPDKDKRYLHIKEPLLEVGYDVIRSDEIRTSGVVVDEVCNHFRDSELVIIDSTGNSQSVSYEIGYCHGVGRSPETTLLIREGTEIPFNYRHFRHRCYKSMLGMQKEIRSFLGTSAPIADSKYGKVLSFVIDPALDISNEKLAKAILDTTTNFSLSGRIETYLDDGFIHQEHNQIIMRTRTRRIPNDNIRVLRFGYSYQPALKETNTLKSHEMIQDIGEYLSKKINYYVTSIDHDPRLSEGSTMKTLRASFEAGFANGDFELGKLKRAYYPKNNPLTKFLS